MSGLGGPLMPLDIDLQPQATLRQHEFQGGRRVFHVFFGHGFVRSLEAEPAQADGSSDGKLQPPEPQRVLSQKTHNINVHFDNPKYKQLRLRAFYAVSPTPAMRSPQEPLLPCCPCCPCLPLLPLLPGPTPLPALPRAQLPKMVVIPSSAALRKQKLLHAVDATAGGEQQRIHLVHRLLGSGSVRAACGLVSRWQLQHYFEPRHLVDKLLQTRSFSAAVRFAREFKLSADHPASALFRKMVAEKHYEGALKHVSARCDSVDGEHTPADVLQLMVGAGNHVSASSAFASPHASAP